MLKQLSIREMKGSRKIILTEEGMILGKEQENPEAGTKKQYEKYKTDDIS